MDIKWIWQNIDCVAIKQQKGINISWQITKKELNQKIVYKNKFSIEHLKESPYQTWKVLSKTRCGIDRDDIISMWKCQQLYLLGHLHVTLRCLYSVSVSTISYRYRFANSNKCMCRGIAHICTLQSWLCVDIIPISFHR